MRQTLKSILERLPLRLTAYREVRDALRPLMLEPTPIPFGLSLAASPAKEQEAFEPVEGEGRRGPRTPAPPITALL